MGLLNTLRQSIRPGSPEPKGESFEERRRHRRIQNVKLTVVIGEQRFKTKDWSLGGMRVQAPGLSVKSNEQVVGKLNGPGLFDRGTFEGMVSWVSETGEVGIRFVAVSRESFVAMSAAQK